MAQELPYAIYYYQWSSGGSKEPDKAPRRNGENLSSPWAGLAALSWCQTPPACEFIAHAKAKHASSKLAVRRQTNFLLVLFFVAISSLR